MRAERHDAQSLLIPNSVTIRRAKAVAFLRSLLAPVLISPKTTVSATCPPSADAMLDANWLRVW
jgi:hypothetical protein